MGPGLIEVNLNLQKNVPLGFREGGRLELKAEVFNLFNRANFAIPTTFRQAINGRTGAVIASAGRITNTVTTSRQIQIGAKLIF